MDIGSPKATFARLVNDDLTGMRRQLVNNVVAIFASDEEPAHGPLVANAQSVVAIGRADLA